MSLWGCNCPILALAACHRRGMVCSQLSLFSPLFCAWAWQCLRLGLAFHVVVIPQSGLLAQVSSLRLQSGHSGQILTLGNAASASLPSPCLQVAGAGICAASLLLCWGSYHWARNLWVLIIVIFFPPCYVALCASKARHRLGRESVSWCLETSLFLRLPSQDGAPSLPPLSLLSSFIFFPTYF